ncbi:MAG TPA: hypothetical protein VK921_01150 [Anditalea sp.]|nr:hypothetical protein [Anditalea sp.]
MRKSIFLIPLLIFLNSCQESIEPLDTHLNEWSDHEPFVAKYNTFSMAVSDLWHPLPLAKGEVSLSEASGLAWSVKNPNKIWTHNDSGNSNFLFLLDSETGEILARYRVEGTVNIDWEDIEVSYGPIEGETYIYLADTGDNNERRPTYTIYRFQEPIYDIEHYGKTINIQPEIDKIIFEYPDGSHDCEALFVDPITKDIYLATKRDFVSLLFVAPYPQKVDEKVTVIKAGEFGFRESSAGTSSLSGDKVLIKNRQEIFFWHRQVGESMIEMLSREPIKAPYAGEPQGEAICFDPEYNYFTLSEELNSSTKPNLFKYTFKKQP